MIVGPLLVEGRKRAMASGISEVCKDYNAGCSIPKMPGQTDYEATKALRLEVCQSCASPISLQWLKGTRFL